MSQEQRETDCANRRGKPEGFSTDTVDATRRGILNSVDKSSCPLNAPPRKAQAERAPGRCQTARNRSWYLSPVWAIIAAPLLTSCLYLDALPTPITENSPPQFSTWRPRESQVVVGLNGQTEVEFQVFATDPDLEDQDQLVLEWDLELTRETGTEERSLGSSTLVRVTQEDLAGTTRARLFCTVTDPSGYSDFIRWDLTLQSP